MKRSQMLRWTILVALLSGSPLSHGAELKSYAFTNEFIYTLSNPELIEVDEGVARLIKQPEIRSVSLIDEYSTNVTRVTDALGVDTVMQLVRSGGQFQAPGEFISRVQDGGNGNVWKVLTAKIGNADFVTDSSQVAHYPLDNDAVLDEISKTSGNTFGTTSWPTDAIRGSHSLSLDNGNGGANLANSALLNGVGAFTLSCWVKIRSHSSKAGFATFRANGLTTGLAQFTSGQLYFWVGSQSARTASPMALNAWTFLAGTWISGSGRLDLYVNGVRVAVDSAQTIPLVMNATFQLGSPTFDGTLRADCSMDDVRIFNRQLAADEIAALYLSPPSPMKFRARSSATTNFASLFVGPDGTTNSAYAGANSEVVSSADFDPTHRY
ncbi:MAG: LamG domain-containing protein, partial [Verrucomicrobia bacterium]|nr:LamG domain-containing protein [Verrucomicrobiota bacterium]